MVAEDCIREYDGVSGDGGGVGGKRGVVVDVAFSGGFGDDEAGASGGDVGGVEDVGVAVCGAGEDVVDFGVPVDGYEGGVGGDGESLFGPEGCGREDVEVALGVAGYQVGGVGGEYDIGFGGGGSGEVGTGRDGGFNLSGIPDCRLLV